LGRTEKPDPALEQAGQDGDGYFEGSAGAGLVGPEVKGLLDVAHVFGRTGGAGSEVAHHEPGVVVLGLGVEGDELGPAFQAGDGVVVAAGDLGALGVDPQEAPLGVLNSDRRVQLL